MTSSSASSQPIVIDASVAVRAVTPTSLSGVVKQHFAGWHRTERSIVAPFHWIAEAVSALRRLVFLGELSAQEANGAAEDLFALGIESVALDVELCRSALRWAERLTQAKAYDAYYLALADAQDGELWTADGRLYRRAKQLGSERVRLVGQ